MSKYKKQIDAEVTRRGLVSVMNETKWTELRNAVRNELQFAPAYQLKVVLNDCPQPEQFEAEVNYLGDWSDECLLPFDAIEWIRIRPRFLRHRGKLIAPETQSVEPEFTAILHRYQIPYRRDDNSIWIYGYTSRSGDLTTGFAS